MNYSKKYLTLSPTHRYLCSEDLQDFDRVVFLNITHNYISDPKESPFMRMKSLKAFYVSNPKCRYYVEKGVLYTDDMEYFFETMELDEDFTYLRESKGHILVAVPPAYPTKDFIVPEGVVGILTGAFDGCNFDTISFPDSLKVVPEGFLRNVSDIKTIFVSSKIKLNYIEGFIELLHFEIKSKDGNGLDVDVLQSWKHCLGLYSREELVEMNISHDNRPHLSDYAHDFVYPNEVMKTNLRTIKSQNDLLDALDNLWQYNEYENFMRAMIFLHIDPMLLYCKEENPARRLIRSIWVTEENAKRFVLSHISSNIKDINNLEPDATKCMLDIEDVDTCAKKVFDDNNNFPKEHQEEYEFNDLDNYAACYMLKENPRHFFNYLGWTYLRKVLNKIAIEILYCEYQKNQNIYVISNLMHIWWRLIDLHEYYILPDNFALSHFEKIAIRSKDISAIYNRLKYLSDYRIFKKGDTYQMYESYYKEVYTLFELLKSDDLWTLGASKKFLQNALSEVSQLEDWIVKNVQVEKVSKVYTCIQSENDLPF